MSPLGVRSCGLAGRAIWRAQASSHARAASLPQCRRRHAPRRRCRARIRAHLLTLRTRIRATPQLPPPRSRIAPCCTRPSRRFRCVRHPEDLPSAAFTGTGEEPLGRAARSGEWAHAGTVASTLHPCSS